MTTLARACAAAGFLLYVHSLLLSQHLYVSPGGSDSSSGLRRSAPVATLTRAVERVREIRSSGARQHTSGLSEASQARRPAVIELLPGTFGLGSGITIKKMSHVRIRPSAAGGVIITGSRQITAWKLVGEYPHSAARLDPRVRDSVYVIDLNANGVKSAGEITMRGGPALEVFIGGRALHYARYPRTGWLLIAGVPQSGDSLYNKGLEREKRYDQVPVGRHYGRIAYDDERISHWAHDDQIFMQGYWTWDWSDSFQKIRRVNPREREIELEAPHHHYGYTKHQRYCFYNVLEELAEPGTYCVDRKTGLVYVYPPHAPDGQSAAEIRVSVAEEPLVTLDSCADVALEGLTFTQSRSSAVVIKAGRDVRIERCRMNRLGDCAIVIDGGMQNGVRSCDMQDLALGAVKLSGGDRATLEAGKNFCIDNHIHHFSRWLRTGQYAVFLTGVGNRVAHNLIHDAPFEAIYLSGNDHTVEFNEIHHVTQETGDAGALHTGRDWTWRGNRIRFNYFHHLQGAGLHGVMGVYLDDWASGFSVTGNVFYKAGRATLIGGGRDNVIENNLYIECAPSVHIDARALSWAGYYFDGTYPDLFQKMDAVNYSKPPYSVRYPELLSLYTDEPRLPKHNRIERNISCGGRWMDVYDYRAFDFSLVRVRDNVIADTAVMRRRQAGQPGWDPYYLNIDTKEGYELLLSSDSSIVRELKGNLFVNGDPGFVDLARGDFRLKQHAPALRMGFRPIPFEKIGLMRKRELGGE